MCYHSKHGITPGYLKTSDDGLTKGVEYHHYNQDEIIIRSETVDESILYVLPQPTIQLSSMLTKLVFKGHLIGQRWSLVYAQCIL